MWLSIILSALTGYLLGNLNGAVSMSVLLGNDDVRSHGSGNAGLTNFIRTFGLGKAGLVIAIDAVKAVLACMVGRQLLTPYGLGLEGAMLGGIAVSLGHDFPALLGFRGGKGILCGFAVAAAVDWRCALLLLIVFAVLVLLTRYVSIGSVAAAAIFSLYFGIVYYERPWVCLGGIFAGVLAIIMHRQNILRLLQHKENKFQIRKSKKK